MEKFHDYFNIKLAPKVISRCAA